MSRSRSVRSISSTPDNPAFTVSPSTANLYSAILAMGARRLTRQPFLGRRSPAGRLARISHHLTVEARHKPAITALRLLAVLNVLFKYASARRAARALY